MMIATPLKRRVRAICDAVMLRLHQRTLKLRFGETSPEYQQYLETQLRRTVMKRRNRLPARARHLIDRTAEHVDLRAARVLCVGCRNAAEVAYFREKGAKSVIGIDLYSNSKDVLVMDMHAMIFASNSFDVIYSSHSLEHALRPGEAIREFVRTVRDGGVIVVEVPVNYEVGKTQDADISDFGSLEQLRQQFIPYVDSVIWSEMSKAGDFDGELGTDALRTMIRIKKHSLSP